MSESRRPGRRGWYLAATIPILLVTQVGCGSDGPGESGEAGAATPTGLATLVTFESDPAVQMEALMSGTLRVNSEGCYSLDRWTLVAPAGSVGDPEGNWIDVVGFGRLSLDDTLRSGGGIVDRLPSGVEPTTEGCAADPDGYAVINFDG